MIKVDGVEQEEKELNHYSPVFHKEMQIAFISTVNMDIVGSMQRTKGKKEEKINHDCYKRHISPLVSKKNTGMSQQ